MSRLFWLDDEAWAAIEPHLPKNQPGARRVDNRRVISGILHVLKTGCWWQDCPAECGPPTTIYNRFNRWSGRQLWNSILDSLVAKGVLAMSASIDSSYVKARRSAHGEKTYGPPRLQATIERWCEQSALTYRACRHDGRRQDGDSPSRQRRDGDRLNRILCLSQCSIGQRTGVHRQVYAGVGHRSGGENRVHRTG